MRLLSLLFVTPMLLLAQAHAQNKGEPGKFDFYLMNVAAPADFCHVPGAGPACMPPRSFVLHGLWTQNNDGTYPVNCSTEHGPVSYEPLLDLTPDLPLLQHEWEKHGTCTGIGPARFFTMERSAYATLYLPRQIQTPARSSRFDTAALLAELYHVNTSFPAGSILLSCREGKLTAVEACFSKELKPVACTNLPSCTDRAVLLEPGSQVGTSSER